MQWFYYGWLMFIETFLRIQPLKSQKWRTTYWVHTKSKALKLFLCPSSLIFITKWIFSFPRYQWVDSAVIHSLWSWFFKQAIGKPFLRASFHAWPPVLRTLTSSSSSTFSCHGICGHLTGLFQSELSLTEISYWQGSMSYAHISRVGTDGSCR